MRPIHTVAVPALAVLILAVVVFEWRSQRQSTQQLKRELAAMVRANESAPESKAQEALASWLALKATEAEPIPTVPPPPSASASASSPVSPRVASRELQTSEIHQHFEAAFVQERVDPQWAVSAAQKTMEKIPALLPEGSKIRSLECRGTMCRLETVHKDRATYWQFAQKTVVDLSSRPWNGAIYAMPVNDDPDDGQMVTYIVREGFDAPEVSSRPSDDG